MELSFSELKRKDVINTADGKRLGRVSDIVFSYPENKILGCVVPGSRSFGLKKTDFFIDLKNIVKIGDDVILVNIGTTGGQGCKARNVCREHSPINAPYASSMGTPMQGRRSYEEYE